MQKRTYQSEAVQALASAYDQGHTRPLIVAPTGSGKNAMACLAIEHVFEGRTMFMAHRAELVHQFVDSVRAWTGRHAEIEMATYHADESIFRRASVIATTVQTQLAGYGGKGRMTRFTDINNLIIDEAHHSPSPSYQRVIDYYRRMNPGLKLLGLTATPDRMDKRAMGLVWDTVAYVYELRTAIDEGWLVPIKQRAVYVEGLDFSSIRTTAGDLNGKDLADVMEYERNLHGVVGPTVEIAGDRKALLFGTSVIHVERMAEIINRYRPDSARWVCGKTPKEDRARLNREFASGRFQFLCNVGTHTEGFDDPGIRLVVMARPTKSRSLYTQCIGRGTRPLDSILDGVLTPSERRRAIASSSKPHVEILDFAGNAGRHKLISTLDILGGEFEEEVRARAAKRIAESDQAMDPDAALARAQEELRLEEEEKKKRETANRVRLRAKVAYSDRAVDPFSVLSVAPDHTPHYAARKPSDKMLDLLARFNIDGSKMSFSEAKRTIGHVMDRSKKGLCTPGQARVLQKYGYDTETVTKKQASQIIDDLKANGWQRNWTA